MSEPQGKARDKFKNAASETSFKIPYDVFQYAKTHKELTKDQFESAYFEALKKFPDTPSVRYAVAQMHLNYLKHNADDLDMKDADTILYHAEQHFRAAMLGETENSNNKQAYLEEYINVMAALSYDRQGWAQEKIYEAMIDAIAMHMQLVQTHKADDLFLLGALLEKRGYKELAFGAFGRADAENRKRPDDKQNPKIAERYQCMRKALGREYRKDDWKNLKKTMAERAELAETEVIELTSTTAEPT